MLYELRTYTVKPGSLGDMVKAAGTLSRDIRKDDYGKLEGYWLTDIGPLNQVVHLWSYADFSERSRLRGALSKNSRWIGEYLPLIRPLMTRQDIRLLNALRPPVSPASAGNTSFVTTAPNLVGRSISGSMRSPQRCQRAKSTPKSSASGRLRPVNRMRYVTSGPILA